MLFTEFAFTLPVGFVDGTGALQRTGVMRLCTAQDELEAAQDGRVRANRAYLSVALLSRVIVQLGDEREVSPATIEGLFSADYAYLQDFFVRINDAAPPILETECPKCGTRFSLDLSAMGGVESS